MRFRHVHVVPAQPRYSRGELGKRRLRDAFEVDFDRAGRRRAIRSAENDGRKTHRRVANDNLPAHDGAVAGRSDYESPDTFGRRHAEGTAVADLNLARAAVRRAGRKDRKSVVEGQSVAVRVELGGRRNIKK